jgi:hypothetical protein
VHILRLLPLPLPLSLPPLRSELKAIASSLGVEFGLRNCFAGVLRVGNTEMRKVKLKSKVEGFGRLIQIKPKRRADPPGA